MILIAHVVNGVARCDVTCRCWKKIGKVGYIFFDATLCKFSMKFPVSLVFAQEPALDGEWTERKEIEINECRIWCKERGRAGKVVEIWEREN